MQCYRLRTILCDTADMTPNTISTLLLMRRASHFVPLHSPDSADSLIFSHPKAGPARRKRRGIYPERLNPIVLTPDGKRFLFNRKPRHFCKTPVNHSVPNRDPSGLSIAAMSRSIVSSVHLFPKHRGPGVDDEPGGSYSKLHFPSRCGLRR